MIEKVAKIWVKMCASVCDGVKDPYGRSHCVNIYDPMRETPQSGGFNPPPQGFLLIDTVY